VGTEHYCRFAKDGQEFVLRSREAIETWDVRTGKQVSSVPVKDGVSHLSPDGKTYFLLGELAGLGLGDTATGRVLTHWDVVVRGSKGLACSPDGKTVAAVHENKEAQVRAAADGKVLASFALPGSAQWSQSARPEVKYWDYGVTFSADGKTLLMGTHAGLIHRWDLDREGTTPGRFSKELPPLSKHHCIVTGVHTLPDGRTRVSTGED